MASNKKLAKRARRAKAKAKQVRTARSDFLEDGESELTISVSSAIIEMLMLMAEAESVSIVEMLTVLIRATGLSGIQSLECEIDTQIILLKVYGRQIEGRVENWMEEAEFLDAYAVAARRLGRDELIDAWRDAHDF